MHGQRQGASPEYMILQLISVILIAFALAIITGFIGSTGGSAYTEAQASFGSFANSVQEQCWGGGSVIKSVSGNLRHIDKVTVDSSSGDVLVAEMVPERSCSAISDKSTCQATTGCSYTSGSCSKRQIQARIRACDEVRICSSGQGAGCPTGGTLPGGEITVNAEYTTHTSGGTPVRRVAIWHVKTKKSFIDSIMGLF